MAKSGLDQEDVTVRTPLVERLSPGAPELQGFDASVGDAGSAPSDELSRSTLTAYARRYRRYTEWCAGQGYQTDPVFITSQKIADFAAYCCTTLRYAPKTVWMTARALELYARRAGQEVSTLEARAVVHKYREALSAAGIGVPLTKSRRGPRSGGRQAT